MIEEIVEVLGDGVEGLAVFGVWEDVEGVARFDEEVFGVMDGAFDGACVVGDAGEDGGVHGFAFEEHALEFAALGIAGVLQEVEHGQGEFAFGDIGAEGFADGFFVADEVDAVVVDLVGGAEFEAVLAHGLDGGFWLLVEVGAELGGDGEEGGGFHLDDAEVFRHGEAEVETALSLEDFAAGDVA